uniref:Ras GEF n=1 Tax=Moniliophthora roreri TaxID=221103 RepID=A0A0W0G0Y3_MONRR
MPRARPGILSTIMAELTPVSDINLTRWFCLSNTHNSLHRATTTHTYNMPSSISYLSKDVAGDIQQCDAESSTSNQPAISLVRPVSQGSRFSLEKGYPSILRVINQIRRSYQDLEILRGLVPIFFASLNSILRSMDSLPEEVRIFPRYEMAKYHVNFASAFFADYMAAARKVPDDIRLVPEVMDMFVHTLQDLLNVADTIVKKNQTCPCLGEKTEEVANESHTRPRGTLSRQSSEHRSGIYLGDSFDVFAQPEVRPQTPTKDPSVVDVEEAVRDPGVAGTPETFTSELPSFIECDTLEETSTSDLKGPQLASGTSIVQKARNLRPSFASLLSSSKSKSSITLAGSVPDGLSSQTDLGSGSKMKQIEEYMLRHKPLPDIPFFLRNSAAYFVPDPEHPEKDIVMPPLEGETVDVRLSPSGDMKAASLTALIRMATSRDLLKDLKICQQLFFGLRYFICPVWVVSKLKERFHEQPPSGMNAAQLRVWTREVATNRIRVGHLIIIWLAQYWDDGVDNDDLINALQQFVLNDLIDRVPDTMSSRIVRLLDDAAHGRVSRKIWRQDHYVTAAQGVEDPEPTNFKVTLGAEDNFTLHLSQFNTLGGQVELARQLTIQGAAKYASFEPECALRYWMGHEERESHAQILQLVRWERSVYLWIIDTVLAMETKEKRVEVLHFWVDVATKCIEMNNFSCANAIRAALVSPPIYHLQETLLMINTQQKARYKVLEDYFNGFDNYGLYREALEGVKDKHQPFIPIIGQLIRDVEVIKSDSNPVSAASGKKLVNLVGVNVVRNIMNVQKVLENGRVPYKFVRIPFIQDWLVEQLNNFPPENEKEINKRFDARSAGLEAKSPRCQQINAWLAVQRDKNYYVFDDPKVLAPKKSKASLVMNRFGLKGAV